MEIRIEVLDYMSKLGEKLEAGLDEKELAYAKMEDPILADKVREIERSER